MSIFNNNVKRLKETYKQINRKVETNHIPLAVGLYTPVITTEKYDYVQFFTTVVVFTQRSHMLWMRNKVVYALPTED